MSESDPIDNVDGIQDLNQLGAGKHERAIDPWFRPVLAVDYSSE